ncbi:hypothetical protein A7A76_07895 [Lysobacter enzymogenes]|uniref:hypothetical protein n=1 Tax=Lysobacter enzymogenes TaxID=69 RepID=UPI0019D24E89|nr:hypothetical protein [Lysobacter enzymogenes]MBN7139016.1 hypothetical protein [Lysobacter enzymogenes]
MPLSIRRAKARAAQLREALEVGETWDASDAERAFNFRKRWDELIAQAPRGKREHYEMLGALIAEESPTFKRLVWST